VGKMNSVRMLVSPTCYQLARASTNRGIRLSSAEVVENVERFSRTKSPTGGTPARAIHESIAPDRKGGSERSDCAACLCAFAAATREDIPSKKKLPPAKICSVVEPRFARGSTRHRFKPGDPIRCRGHPSASCEQDFWRGNTGEVVHISDSLRTAKSFRLCIRRPAVPGECSALDSVVLRFFSLPQPHEKIRIFERFNVRRHPESIDKVAVLWTPVKSTRQPHSPDSRNRR